MEPIVVPRGLKRVRVPLEGGGYMEGELAVAREAQGIVVFAHGSGSSRHSPRNQTVAYALHRVLLGTLLLDLLTEEEAHIDRITSHLRFDIDFLAGRLVRATEWLRNRREASSRSIGYFGASTGAAAALVAATKVGDAVKAIVSRGGRPDLAGAALPRVQQPTLLIVGSRDTQVLELNRAALERLECVKRLEIIQGAGHLFEEPGSLDRVAQLAGQWFRQHLPPKQTRRSSRARAQQ